MKPDVIRVITVCLIRDKNRILAARAVDRFKGETFHRLLGGGLEFGETVEEGIRREIHEELGCGLTGLRRLDTLENIFTFEGKMGHEIVILFSGELDDPRLGENEQIDIVEQTKRFTAYWVDQNDFLEGREILYPAMDLRKYL